MSRFEQAFTADRPRANLEDLMAQAAHWNQRPLSEKMGWFWYVGQRDDGSYSLERMEGIQAEESRERATGSAKPRWVAEPGEMEWIGRATAEYLTRYPTGTREHFQAMMNRWSAAKPWQRESVA